MAITQLEQFRNVEYEYVNMDDTFIARGLQLNMLVDKVNEFGVEIENQTGPSILKNTINEYTLDTGVTVDGVLIKDNEISIDYLGNPTANKTLSFGANTLKWAFTNPFGGVTYEWLGAASGHLNTYTQSTGVPGAGTHMIHMDADSANVVFLHMQHAIATTRVYYVGVDGDTSSVGRFQWDTNGKLEWGDGTSAVDVSLERSAASTLNVTGSFNVGGTAVSLDGHTHSYLPLTGGAITGGSGLDVTSATLPLQVFRTSAVTNTVEIYSTRHTTSSTFADGGGSYWSMINTDTAGTGNIRLNVLRTGGASNNASFKLEIMDGGSLEDAIYAIAGGAVELYHDNNKVFETAATGASMTGTLTGTATLTLQSTSGAVSLNHAGANTKLVTTATGISVTGTVTVTGTVANIIGDQYVVADAPSGVVLKHSTATVAGTRTGGFEVDSNNDGVYALDIYQNHATGHGVLIFTVGTAAADPALNVLTNNSGTIALQVMNDGGIHAPSMKTTSGAAATGELYADSTDGYRVKLKT